MRVEVAIVSGTDVYMLLINVSVDIGTAAQLKEPIEFAI